MVLTIDGHVHCQLGRVVPLRDAEAARDACGNPALSVGAHCTVAIASMCNDEAVAKRANVRPRATRAAEHAALRKEWEQMIPQALEEWRYLDERLHTAQQKLRSIFDSVEALT